MQTNTNSQATKKIDWQGHRGARGLLPENTIPAFLKALEFPVTTLELDLAISRDGQCIITHEPWMSHHICSKPDGSPVLEAEAQNLKIYKMTYEEIKKYDCGSRGNERFPDQQVMRVHKPSLRDMVQAVDSYCEKQGLPLPRFNIEIKSEPEHYDIFQPQPALFVEILLSELTELGIRERVCIQSFDENVVEEVQKHNPNLMIAFLVENEEGIAANLAKLSFKPAIYSPYFKSLTPKSIDTLHQAHIKVIPWTVNDTTDMKQLIEMGVDGIITDYPNRILEIL